MNRLWLNLRNSIPIVIYLPVKIHEDAGFDCYVHHFQRYDTIEGVFKLMESGGCITTNGKKTTVKMNANTITIFPNGVISCGLGIASEIPNGYYVNLMPRSGLASKQNIVVIIGTIDAGYRNEWIAILHNFGITPQDINIGDRVCQMVVRKLENVVIEETEELAESIRGMNGLGSSGK